MLGWRRQRSQNPRAQRWDRGTLCTPSGAVAIAQRRPPRRERRTGTASSTEPGPGRLPGRRAGRPAARNGRSGRPPWPWTTTMHRRQRGLREQARRKVRLASSSCGCVWLCGGWCGDGWGVHPACSRLAVVPHVCGRGVGQVLLDTTAPGKHWVCSPHPAWTADDDGLPTAGVSACCVPSGVCALCIDRLPALLHARLPQRWTRERGPARASLAASAWASSHNLCECDAGPGDDKGRIVVGTPCRLRHEVAVAGRHAMRSMWAWPGPVRHQRSINQPCVRHLSLPACVGLLCACGLDTFCAHPHRRKGGGSSRGNRSVRQKKRKAVKLEKVGAKRSRGGGGEHEGSPAPQRWRCGWGWRRGSLPVGTCPVVPCVGRSASWARWHPGKGSRILGHGAGSVQACCPATRLSWPRSAC